MAKDDPIDKIPHLRKEPRPDFSQPIKSEKLPEKLQKLVDRDASLLDEIYDGDAPESTESSIRYAAYATRIRTILLSAQRYVAYTSDIGESFRPVAHPYLIKGAYAVSWSYLAGDVAHEGYKAYLKNQRVLHPEPPSNDDLTIVMTAEKSVAPLTQTTEKSLTQKPVVDTIDDYRVVMAQRAIFQGVASMGLPAFTIHSIVRYSGRALKEAKNTRIRSYGPIGLGLAAVPFLPYMFDKPVEEAVEWTFHKAFPRRSGERESKENKLKEL